MNFAKRLILVFAVLISCVGCDQATKSIAASTLPEMRTFSYIGDTLRLQLTYNRGAFLSFGYSLPDVWWHSIFTIGVGFFLTGALAFALLSKPGRFPVVFAVSLFLAGGVGNFIDRVIHSGSVVDFINIGIGPLRTGIFNFADVSIMAGSLILFLAALRRKKEDG
jgi:signal peptidase II